MFQAFVFQGKIAQVRNDLTIHTLDSTQLFYYLLNPSFESINTKELGAVREAHGGGLIALPIEPLWTEKPAYLAGFVRAPVDLLPGETLLIDLRPTETEILAAMKPKGRYNLRLSLRRRVETEFTTDSQAIPLFYDIFWN
jgi:hypothetical protein